MRTSFAFRLTFLFSGCAYWQERIESIVWAHNKTSRRAKYPRDPSHVPERPEPRTRETRATYRRDPSHVPERPEP
eukprot:7740690-Pyramimonas_sp.AAC.1